MALASFTTLIILRTFNVVKLNAINNKIHSIISNNGKIEKSGLYGAGQNEHQLDKAQAQDIVSSLSSTTPLIRLQDTDLSSVCTQP